MPLSDAAMAFVKTWPRGENPISCFRGAAPAAPSRILRSPTSSMRSDIEQ